MILDAKSGLRGTLFNAATGERIPFARRADLGTGEWEALAATPDGRHVLEPRRLVRGRCPLRFVPAPVVAQPPMQQQPPRVWSPPAPDGRRVSRTWGRLQFVFPTCLCEHAGCERPATWLTCDEREGEPGVGADGTRYETGEVAARHYWCDWHYQSPTFTSLRGVVSAVAVEARPQ